MIYIILWPLGAIVVAGLAAAKGRSGLGWFALSLVISPIVAGLIVLFVEDRSPKAQALKAQYLARQQTKTCPRCAECVKRKALVCRFCGYSFEQQHP